MQRSALVDAKCKSISTSKLLGQAGEPSYKWKSMRRSMLQTSLIRIIELYGEYGHPGTPHDAIEELPASH